MGAQTDTLVSRPIAWPAAPVYAESPATQLADLRRWTHDYSEWKTWFLKWRSRPEPGTWMSARERRRPPVPPAWLPGWCDGAGDPVGALGDGCRDWREWAAGSDALVLRQQAAVARLQHELPSKTQWWERVHVDALWPMTRTGSSTLGVVGMHATVHLTDRFQVFLAPGAMFMRLPAITGGMTWSAATDWGFSYRLGDFRMPGVGRASTLHFNFVRVWPLGQSMPAMPGEMYLAGFSVSFKRR